MTSKKQSIAPDSKHNKKHKHKFSLTDPTNYDKNSEEYEDSSITNTDKNNHIFKRRRSHSQEDINDKSTNLNSINASTINSYTEEISSILF
jgi:hypothetical protein